MNVPLLIILAMGCSIFEPAYSTRRRSSKFDVTENLPPIGQFKGDWVLGEEYWKNPDFFPNIEAKDDLAQFSDLVRELNLSKTPSRVIHVSDPSQHFTMSARSATTNQLFQVRIDGSNLAIDGSKVYTSPTGNFLIVDSIVYDNKTPIYDLNAKSLLPNMST